MMQPSPSGAAPVASIHMRARDAGLRQRARIPKGFCVDDLRTLFDEQAHWVALTRPIHARLHCSARRNPDRSAAAATFTRRQAGHRANQRLARADEVSLFKQEPEALPVLVVRKRVEIGADRLIDIDPQRCVVALGDACHVRQVFVVRLHHDRDDGDRHSGLAASRGLAMHQIPVSSTALPVLLGAIVVVERELDVAEEAQLLVGEQLDAVAIGGHGHAQRLILEPRR